MVIQPEGELRSTSPIRVFLIDEEVVVRAGVRILIDSWPNSQVVGEADVPHQAIEAVEAIKPDLIVFSHTGRSIASLAGLGDLIMAAGRIPLGVLTSSSDPDIGAAATHAGAKWVIWKQHAAIELRKAIEAARSDEGDEGVEEKPLAATRPGPKFRQYRRARSSDPDALLTNREREVAVLVSKGCTNRQAGTSLGITEVTVRHHLTSIFSKLGIANRFELIAWLYRRGSLDTKN